MKKKEKILFVNMRLNNRNCFKSVKNAPFKFNLYCTDNRNVFKNLSKIINKPLLTNLIMNCILVYKNRNKHRKYTYKNVRSICGKTVM